MTRWCFVVLFFSCVDASMFRCFVVLFFHASTRRRVDVLMFFPRFQHEFESLASVIEGGTARESRKAAGTSEFDAALLLHARSEELMHKVRQISWCRQPRSILAGTAPSTCEPSFKGHPLGRTPRNRNATAGPQSSRTSSGGPSRRWVSSWQLRGVKRFLPWLALWFELTNPTALSQLTEYLQVRLQEQGNRGSLKGSHHSMVFLEAMAGVSPQHRFTDSQLYNVLYQELLVAALPGSPAKQAPRVLPASLVALEHLVVSAQTPRYYRVFARSAFSPAV